MANASSLTIVDRNGWQKTVKIEKAVMRIGSAQVNDIRLASDQISPTHLQIHYLPKESVCKILNLGSELIISRGETQDTMLPYAKAQIGDGDEVLMGEYRIQFSLPLIVKTIREADSLEASLLFTNPILSPHTATAGWLTIKNTGEQSPCQFHVSLSGLPEDCIQIDPIPLLYAGAQGEVRVQLLHQTLYPSAGAKNITITVSSPKHYPGEQVVIQQGIYIEPVFEHSLELIDDITEGTELKQIEEIPSADSTFTEENNSDLKQPEQRPPPAIPSPVIQASPEKEQAHLKTMPDEISELPKNTDGNANTPDITKPESEIMEAKIDTINTLEETEELKPRVVQSLSEDFWDEG